MAGNITPVQITITADDQTRAAIAAAMARLQALKGAGGEAGASLTKNFHEAKGAAALLSEELDVKLNRHLRSVLANSSLIGPLLSAAFVPAAIIGFAEVAARIPQAIGDIIDKIYGIEAAENYLKTQGALNKHLTDIAARVLAINRETQLLGLTGAQQAQLRAVWAITDKKEAESRLRQLEQQWRAEKKLSEVRDLPPVVGGLSGAAISGMDKLFGSHEDSKHAEIAAALNDQIILLNAEIKELGANADKNIKEKLVRQLEEAKRAAAKAAEEAATRSRKLAESIKQETAEWQKLFALQKQGKEAEAAYSIVASEATAYVTKGLEKVITVEELRNHGLQEANKLMLENISHQLELGEATEAWRSELAHLDDAFYGVSHPKYDVMKTLNESLTNSFDNMFQDIALGTRGISQAFESMASSIAASVMQAVVKMLILGPLLRGISSLLGAFAPTSAIPLFGGRGLSLGPGDFAVGPPHAAGGPVMPNMSYMVGERGPEMFMPSSAGSIVSNSALGGARIVNQVTVVNQTGRPVSAQIGKSAFNGREYVTTVVLQDLRENGPIRQALGGS